MRKKVGFILTLLFVLAIFITTSVSAEEKSVEKVVLKTNQVNQLKQQGFPENVIEDFTGAGYSFEEINELEFLSSDDKYYKITETHPPGYKDISDAYPLTSKSDLDLMRGYTQDDFDSKVEEISFSEFVDGSKESIPEMNTLSSSATTTTSYKRMTTTISKISNNNYKVTNSVSWTKMPLHRKHDVIGVGLNAATSPTPGTEYAIQRWSTMSGGTTGQAVYTKNSNKWDRSQDYGLYFKLKSDTATTSWARVTMYMEYNVAPNNSNTTLIDAHGHYAHQENSTNITPSFDILAGKLTIEAKHVKKYTYHPKTHAQIKR